MNEKMTAAELDVQILTALGQFRNPKDRNQIAALIIGTDAKRVASRLRALAKLGSVIQVAGGRGSVPATYMINRNI